MGVTISLSEYKEFTGALPEDTANDLRIERTLAAVLKYVERLTCKTFGPADYTEQYQGNQAQELILRNHPINSVTSVELLDENQGTLRSLEGNDYRISDSKNYLFRPEGWMKYGYSEFVSGRVSFPIESIKVVYNAGENIPEDIKWAIIEITADYINKTATGGRGLKNYKISDVSLTWRDSISAQHLKLIKTYKNGACFF